MYDSDESVTDHICLTQKRKREREEPSKKDIQRMYIWLRGEGLSAVVPPSSLSRTRRRRGTGERKRGGRERR